MNDAGNARFRALPQLQRVLELPDAAALSAQYSRAELVSALRGALADARAQLLHHQTPAPDTVSLLRAAAAILRETTQPALRRVINATGVVLHTNLGRAPLPREAVDAAIAAGGYCNLEYDLVVGGRGKRLHGVEPLLCALTGAQAGVAVNNNAAAVLLALSALAAGGEVIVSRGELVEIGGGFRIPDVIQQGGARLIEVGTTNKTRIADYEAAITPATRMLLKVHQSNYRIVGFTAEATLTELAVLAQARGLLLADDLGSGTMADLPALGRPRGPTVREAVGAGADLVMFSGDKVLGGPQAGMVVGTHAAIDPLRHHPLMRAVRLDKVTLAALEATLRLYNDPARAAVRVPALRMLGQTEATLQARAERLLALLDGMDARIESSRGEAGAGSLPGETIPSRAVSIAPASGGAETLAGRLRTGTPSVVGRLAHGRVVLDVVAVTDDETVEVAAALRAAVA